MIAVSAEIGLPPLQFAELAGQFRITLFLQPVQPGLLDATNQAIIDWLRQDNGQAVKDIAQAIGLSTRATRTRLNALIGKGVVRVVGTGPHDPKRRFFVCS